MRILLHILLIASILSCSKAKQEKYDQLYISPLAVGLSSSNKVNTSGALFSGVLSSYNLNSKQTKRLVLKPAAPHALILNTGPKQFVINSHQQATFFSYLLDKDENVITHLDSVVFGVTDEQNHKSYQKGRDLGFITVLVFNGPEKVGTYRITANMDNRIFAEPKVFELATDEIAPKNITYTKLVNLADNTLHFHITQDNDRDIQGNPLDNGGQVQFILKSDKSFTAWNGMIMDGMVSMDIKNPSLPGDYEMYLMQGDRLISDIKKVRFLPAFTIKEVAKEGSFIVIGPIVDKNNNIVPDGEEVLITFMGENSSSVEVKEFVKNGYAKFDLSALDGYIGEHMVLVEFRGTRIRKTINVDI